MLQKPYENEKKERKSLRKILGPKKPKKGRDGYKFRLRSDQDSYDTFEGIFVSMRRRSLLFYGHLEDRRPRGWLINRSGIHNLYGFKRYIKTLRGQTLDWLKSGTDHNSGLELPV